MIIHAGDVGKRNGDAAGVLETLAQQAPVLAVRGNHDRAAWAATIPETRHITLGGVRIHLLHDLAQLACDPVAAGIQVVIAGHSHKPLIESRDGVLYVNPGSAGPRRFRLPVSVGRLWIDDGQVRAACFELAV